MPLGDWASQAQGAVLGAFATNVQPTLAIHFKVVIPASRPSSVHHPLFSLASAWFQPFGQTRQRAQTKQVRVDRPEPALTVQFLEVGGRESVERLLVHHEQPMDNGRL